MQAQNGFVAEAYFAGIIQRSKYITHVNPEWTPLHLLKLSRRSKWLSNIAAKWMEHNDVTVTTARDVLDGVYGIDFLVEIDGETIAIDLTANPEKLTKKRDRLRESAKLFPSISKWAVVYWDNNLPLQEMDILDIYLDDEKFQTIFLIEAGE